MTPSIPPTAPVLVTGCSSGIGRATVQALLRGPRPVWATARQVGSRDDLAAAGARVLALDVTDEDSMAAAMAAVQDAHGPVGGLVNNAGYGEYGPVEEVPPDDPAGWRGLPREQVRGGGAERRLALRDRGFGIGVSVVAPGPVRTGFAEEATAVPEGDGPYAGFMRGVAGRNASAYVRPDARGTLDAEDVAEVIVTALESVRPKARYPVGFVSREVVGARRLLPTAVWDALLRRQYPTP